MTLTDLPFLLMVGTVIMLLAMGLSFALNGDSK